MADSVLEAFDLQAQRRLSTEQHVGRPREAAKVDDADEGAEQVDVQVTRDRHRSSLNQQVE